jgi:hypothetical protein
MVTSVAEPGVPVASRSHRKRHPKLAATDEPPPSSD